MTEKRLQICDSAESSQLDFIDVNILKYLINWNKQNSYLINVISQQNKQNETYQ